MAGDMSKTDPSNGGPRERRVPDGDNRERLICPDCGFINYENPKIVVGAVVVEGDSFLLCRRAIPPRKGYWTIPAGYMETGETAAAGAAREAHEEAGCEIAIDALLAVYNIPRISQVQLIYRAALVGGVYEAGEESLEVDLFDWDGIPWDEIAFPSVHWALAHYREVEGAAEFAPRSNPPGDFGEY